MKAIYTAGRIVWCSPIFKILNKQGTNFRDKLMQRVGSWFNLHIWLSGCLMYGLKQAKKINFLLYSHENQLDLVSFISALVMVPSESWKIGGPKHLYRQCILPSWLLSASFWRIITAGKRHITCYNLNLNSWQN